MGFYQLLERKQKTIRSQWFDIVMATYAPDAARFFSSKKDSFQNPVGSITEGAISALFEGLLREADTEKARTHLEAILRIRAIQNFTPSQAVGFVFQLKNILRDTLPKDLQDPDIRKEYDEFEFRIDDLGLLAFDIYMECREKIYELKKNVEKNKIYKAFARAGLVADIAEDSPDLNFV